MVSGMTPFNRLTRGPLVVQVSTLPSRTRNPRMLFGIYDGIYGLLRIY